MKFWDSSAVVPLLVPEGARGAIRRVYRADPAVVAWWRTEIECVSATVRRQRLGGLGSPVAAGAFIRLDALRDAWHEIEPGQEVREPAKRFLRVHDLRAADALQLAAAFFAAEGRPSTLEFVCLDARLSEAARREGFVLTPVAGSRSCH